MSGQEHLSTDDQGAFTYHRQKLLPKKKFQIDIPPWIWELEGASLRHHNHPQPIGSQWSETFTSTRGSWCSLRSPTTPGTTPMVSPFAIGTSERWGEPGRRKTKKTESTSCVAFFVPSGSVERKRQFYPEVPWKKLDWSFPIGYTNGYKHRFSLWSFPNFSRVLAVGCR